MLKYACSVKGNIKQTSKSKNFIRLCVFFIRISEFFTHMRKCGRLVKAALIVYEAEIGVEFESKLNLIAKNNIVQTVLLAENQQPITY